MRMRRPGLLESCDSGTMATFENERDIDIKMLHFGIFGVKEKVCI